MVLIWVGRDYYKRRAKLISRLNQDGERLLTLEVEEDDVWISVPAYTHNFYYCMERALLDE